MINGFDVAYASSRGRWPTNEDSLLVVGKGFELAKKGSDIAKHRILNELTLPADPLLLAVADGMSNLGHSGLASEVVVKALLAEWLSDAGHWGANWLKASRVRGLQVDLCHHFEKIGYLGQGATTLAAAHVQDGQVTCANAGDSRAYLIRSGDWLQLSKDHTWAEELRDAGKVDRNTQLASCYSGMTSGLMADWAEDDDFPVHLESASLAVGDHILLCTDGLDEELTVPRLKATWHPEFSPKKQLAHWFALVIKELGGPDNVSAVLVRVL